MNTTQTKEVLTIRNSGFQIITIPNTPQRLICRTSRLFISFWILLAFLFSIQNAPAETVKSLQKWEITGFLAAIQDTDDEVIRIALEHPKAREILATEPNLVTR